MSVYLAGIKHFLARYYHRFCEIWKIRKTLDSSPRTEDEYAFLPAHLELIERPVSYLPRLIGRLIVLFILLALIWAIVGKVEIVAVSVGKLSYSGRSKTIQPIENAIVKRIYVRDGQIVQEGETLIELTALGAEADYEKSKQILFMAKLAKARAEALLKAIEHNQPPVLILPEGIDINDPNAIQAQQLISEQFRTFTTQKQQADSLLHQRQAERETISAQIIKYTGLTKIEQEKFNDFALLYKRKAIPKHTYFEQETRFIETRNELNVQKSRLVETDASIAQAENEKALLTYKFIQDTQDALRQADEQVEQLVLDQEKTSQRQSTTSIKSPVTGTVQQLSVHTIGGVVTGAQPLMVIVPKEDKLEVNALISNKDIGFIKVNQPVTIKIEAFPYTRYGYITGRVKSVSFDAIEHEQLGPVFSTIIEMDKDYLMIEENKVMLTAGMSVSAEIKTGERRVITYLLSPLQTTINESLRER
ncbi:HlyD family type I secretion periplasmic adaptor subunit [Pasteurellaceae bacterium LIM206]|nr:HlyD family type I secretion periplasmic adaptor subunit [Pasteurellaceae bacterium LIM206]